MRIVVCAAVRKGKIILAGARHFDDVMRTQLKAIPEKLTDGEQGFIDQKGVFMDRKVAWRVARKAGQIRRPTGWEKTYLTTPCTTLPEEGILFSENLY